MPRSWSIHLSDIHLRPHERILFSLRWNEVQLLCDSASSTSPPETSICPASSLGQIFSTAKSSKSTELSNSWQYWQTKSERSITGQRQTVRNCTADYKFYREKIRGCDRPTRSSKNGWLRTKPSGGKRRKRFRSSELPWRSCCKRNPKNWMSAPRTCSTRRRKHRRLRTRSTRALRASTKQLAPNWKNCVWD